MSKHLLHSIEQAERDYTDARNERIERAGEYASGYCSCCGSDDGLDGDEPCGYCVKGRAIIDGENK